MEQLKAAIMRKINRTLESPKDFEYLSEQIQSAVGEYLSPTTIKLMNSNDLYPHCYSPGNPNSQR